MSLLDQLNATIEEREDNYDNPLPNFLRIAMYWMLWKETDDVLFDPLDVIFMMDLMKTAREKHNHSDDTLLDKTGYTVSCYERIDEAMKLLGYDGIERFRFMQDQVKTRIITDGEFLGYLYDMLLDYKRMYA